VEVASGRWHMNALLRRPALDQEEDLYPSSDGKPMGETTFHISASTDLKDALESLLAPLGGWRVVANLIFYYEEGNPKANRAPDVMVLRGAVKPDYRVFKTWAERAKPVAAIDVTSKKTRKEDQRPKRELYARLGVQDYFLFDPEQDWLERPLMGFKLVQGAYVPIPPAADGSLVSEVMQVRLIPEGHLVRVQDLRTGRLIPHTREAFEAFVQLEEERIRSERAQQQAEAAQREAATAQQQAQTAQLERATAQQQAQAAQRQAEEEAARRAVVEEELARLKEQLIRQGKKKRK
jgi:Uma2 family endonuclease